MAKLNLIHYKMLLQTPSKILKNDLRNWDISDEVQLCKIIEEEKFRTQEIIINEFSEFLFQGKKDFTTIVLPLFGKLRVNNRTIAANEIFVMKKNENFSLQVKNLIEKASDFLIIEIKENSNGSFEHFSEINVLRNALSKISNKIKTPNYIGIFDGREELQYSLENMENKIFAMVINGAFEFQNRLMETRDAILLWEIGELEFEALSENALVLFFEI